ncbi:MAG: molybdopterin-dependent oxidoreductase [Verrucomicrobiales bacterium]|nr:molybdopterin-dependent oxidoreductase [Verrucomicrobiales bacterium]
MKLLDWPGEKCCSGRRDFLKRAGVMGLMSAFSNPIARAFAEEALTLPFDNGERPLVQYPQKRPLIRLTARPPQLETPFRVFNEDVITPNDAFFVRYHLTNSPPAVDPDKFRLQVKGNVNTPLRLSIAELKSGFEPAEIVAVNQCSGNSRGFSQPRVAGGQLGHGAMGNARWKGVPLKEVLNKAGLGRGARQATFDGLDTALLPQTPDFIKGLDLDHALDGEVLLAYEMNGADLPWLNGFPLRLVVPGYYGTYWVKHLHEINVIDTVYDGYWMNPAYRIPDNSCACVEPGTTPRSTVPIARYNVRSFITSLPDGGQIESGRPVTVRGIAFDGGSGIREVLFSADDGRTWRAADLGRDFGKYSFREWTVPFTPDKPGAYSLKAKATNRIGQSQPFEPLWNPAGYMRNVVEAVRVSAI